MFELWCLHIPVEDRTSFAGTSFSDGFSRMTQTATFLFFSSYNWRRHTRVPPHTDRSSLEPLMEHRAGRVCGEGSKVGELKSA
jgi:hypothetical protein